jgi:hypothetical protein
MIFVPPYSLGKGYVPPAGGGGGGGFTPYPNPTLPSSAQILHWFAADHKAYKDVEGTILAASGDPVAAWGNSGNSAEMVTQPTLANRPIFRTGGAGGRPYLECNAASQQYFLDIQNFDYPSGISSYGGFTCMAFVMKITNPANGLRKNIFGWGGGSKPSFHVEASGALRGWKDQWNTSTFFADGQIHGAIMTHDGSCNRRWGSTGIAVANSSSCTNSNSTSSTAVQFLRSTTSGLSGYFDGEFYECIVWNGAGYMSATNCQAVLNYFKTKYGIA